MQLYAKCWRKSCFCFRSTSSCVSPLAECEAGRLSTRGFNTALAFALQFYDYKMYFKCKIQNNPICFIFQGHLGTVCLWKRSKPNPQMVKLFRWQCQVWSPSPTVKLTLRVFIFQPGTSSFVLFLVLLLVNNNHLCRNWNKVVSWKQHEIPVGLLDGNALAYFTYSQRGSVPLMVAFWFKNICSNFPPCCAVIRAFEDRRDILHYMAHSLPKHCELEEDRIYKLQIWPQVLHAQY